MPGAETRTHDLQSRIMFSFLSRRVYSFQVLAGGRGKGKFQNYRRGGVQLVYSPDEVENVAKGMLGKDLI